MIAKFPGKDDERDVSSWELIIAELARDAGIEMSECRRESFSKRGSTFLTKRFDRVGEGRLHFASAMTLLGRKDGDDAEAGVSYLVFSIAVSNTDDHLQNHGFLLNEKGWRLSPAHDINPSPDSAGLLLAVDEHDNSLDFGLALFVAKYFRFTVQDAQAIIDSIKAVVATWREKAGVDNTLQGMGFAVILIPRRASVTALL
jgi:serine/threonine-protein kinase HipA